MAEGLPARGCARIVPEIPCCCHTHPAGPAAGLEAWAGPRQVWQNTCKGLGETRLARLSGTARRLVQGSRQLAPVVGNQVRLVGSEREDLDHGLARGFAV